MKEAIKALIPNSGVNFLKSTVDSISQVTWSLVVKSRFLSAIYYVLVSNNFSRENQAVIYGKLQYYKDLKNALDSQYLLRRNIHRLEKGIIMKNRRDTFALDYIEETVNCYKYAVENRKSDIGDSGELKWANDVLEKYFDLVSTHPVIDKAKSVFLSVIYKSHENQKDDKKFIPYKREIQCNPPVCYESFLKLSYQRRSVRWYLPEKVPRDLIDKAILLASQSPSACNRQPFEFRIFDEPGRVKKVSSIPMGTRGFSHNFPAIVVVVGKLRAYFNERDRHVIYIDAALASMSFMYALETLGLSSCPINWPDIEESEKKMSSFLNLEPDERVIMLISVGYADPDGLVPYSQKKTLDLLRRYN
ncbi:nitroreductase family protein [Roseofilum sp. BLCC_M91]|uniref:Nitroreductase family protein n=1 Tax=Roseofilum halophilum BLCC-M91 TaxID=3022259 RepID=A0ABT7BSC4_9CYAN|nr:nitroreductase family protein [Roseofilum halophilum]MDJ1181414.1 nitroreductase family protein [Roseofilum halophilum BLCC-M91]